MEGYELAKDIIMLQQQLARLDYKLDLLLKAADIKEEKEEEKK